MRFDKIEFTSAYGTSKQLPPSKEAEIVFSGRSNVGKSSLESLLRKVDFDRENHRITVTDRAAFAQDATFAVPLVTFGQWEVLEAGMLRIFRPGQWEFFCKVDASAEYEISDELIDDDILFDEPVRRILFTFKDKAKNFKISTTFILEEKQ